MRTKKYWIQYANDRVRERDRAEKEVDLLRQSLRFLLEDSNTYRVKLTAITQYLDGTLHGKPATCFEYVDGSGRYHRHVRPIAIEKLELISTNADTAVLKFETAKNKYTYWILNKADETVSEISQELLLDICDAEVKRLITHGK